MSARTSPRLLTEIRAREIAEAEGLAVEDIPVHQAADPAARPRTRRYGRTRVPASERRAAERAEENQEAEAEDSDEAEDVIEGRGRGEGRSRGRAEHGDEGEAEADVETTDTVPASAAAGDSTDKEVKEEG